MMHTAVRLVTIRRTNDRVAERRTAVLLSFGPTSRVNVLKRDHTPPRWDFGLAPSTTRPAAGQPLIAQIGGCRKRRSTVEASAPVRLPSNPLDWNALRLQDFVL